MDVAEVNIVSVEDTILTAKLYQDQNLCDSLRGIYIIRSVTKQPSIDDSFAWTICNVLQHVAHFSPDSMHSMARHLLILHADYAEEKRHSIG